MKNKIFAIILARGGSKGIKNKNLKKINNKPLLKWSIDHCKNSKKIKETWLSSDSLKILKLAKDNGINVIKRPKELALDTSSSEDAWMHAINFIERKKKTFDIVLAIQPTSAIRGKKDFDKAIQLFLKKKYDSLFSCSEVSDYFVWTENSKKLKALYDFKKRKPRQFLTKKYLENGSFFIFDKNKFKKFKNRFFGKIGKYVQEFYKSFQIDEYNDMIITSSILKNIKNFKN
jgi:N-acylneuraminate cytidylyltransferase